MEKDWDLKRGNPGLGGKGAESYTKMARQSVKENISPKGSREYFGEIRQDKGAGTTDRRGPTSENLPSTYYVKR